MSSIHSSKNNTPELNVIVLLGAPGSGKGTLSNLCVEKFGWKQLSTGNLCRKHIAEQTEIGKQIDFVIKSGKLVSDNIIIDMVDQWLTKQLESGQSVLLDGYPRNVMQAKALNKLLYKQEFENVSFKVVRFDTSDDVVINRLGNRRVCQNKSCQAVYSMLEGSPLRPKNDMICDKCASPLIIRHDDKLEVIQERLKGYREHEKALLDFYKKTGQEVIDVDASDSLVRVFDIFKKKIGLED